MKNKEKICECGFSKNAHDRRDFFKSRGQNMVFVEGKPCKKFKEKTKEEIN